MSFIANPRAGHYSSGHFSTVQRGIASHDAREILSQLFF